MSYMPSGVPNGASALDENGKIHFGQIPSIVIVTTYVVGSEAAMLALSSAEQGDVAIRTDLNKSFILTSGPYSVLSNWQEMLSPTDAVQSVNGQSGTVTLTKSDIGLSNVDNTSDAAKPVSTAQATVIGIVQTATNIVQSAVSIHVSDLNNPHGVTKTQMGLSNVDNTSDANKPVSTAQAAADAVIQGNLTTHTSNMSNPHNVTKAQLGLGNVDNTSDINKPVSTLQQAAIDASAYTLTSGEVSATANATTSSGIDSLLNSMTFTPAAGTYLVWFNTSITADTAGAAISCSFYVNGVQKADSLRKIIPADGGALSTGSARGTMDVNGRIAVTGSQAIEIRWSTSSGTATCHARTMNWLRVL